METWIVRVKGVAEVQCPLWAVTRRLGRAEEGGKVERGNCAPMHRFWEHVRGLLVLPSRDCLGTQVSIFLRIITNLSPWQQISLLVGHAPQTRTVPRPLQTSPAASPGTPCAPGSQPQLWDAPSTFLAPCSSAVPLAAEVVAASGTSYWCIPASPVLPLHNILVLINDFFVLNFPILVEGKTSIP